MGTWERASAKEKRYIRKEKNNAKKCWQNEVKSGILMKQLAKRSE